MRQPCVDDRVELVRGVPELGLQPGDVGTVQSIWFAPTAAFEVEFRDTISGFGGSIRALLLPEQLAVRVG